MSTLFAQRMIDDHTAAGEKMKAAAESDSVAPPDAMAQGDQAKYDQLAAAQGNGKGAQRRERCQELPLEGRCFFQDQPFRLLACST